MSKIYILAAKRTAIGTFDGTLKNTSAVDLAVSVVKNVIEESGVKPEQVKELILGNVLSAGLGQNIARQVAVKSGIPDAVPSYTVNKVCGSGMKAIQLAYQSILTGDSDLVIAGGTENMNQAPYIAPGVRGGLRMGNGTLVDTMVNDGLWCSLNDYHMGITAENLAEKYSISREEQDAYAAESQARAANALKEDVFKDEIVPIEVRAGKQTVTFEKDEHPRETSVEKLAKLRPAFKKDGTVTAGNASGINDGAAILVLASEEFVKANNVTPLAEVTGFASAGVDPQIMGIGPVAAINKLISKSGQSLTSFDLFELNEAFAVQSLSVVKELGIDTEKVNVNGGAIALGHPIGASGARIVVTLLHEMKRRGVKIGLASLCIGGGMGIAMTVRMEK